MKEFIRKIIATFYDKRTNHRYTLIGAIPGEITSGQQSFLVHPIDVSHGGLGILIDPAPEIGTELKFTAPELPEAIIFRVKHIETPDIAIDSLKKMRRCGLERVGDVDVLACISKISSLMIQE